VVSEPDMRTAEQARAYFAELQDILQTLGVSGAKMEEGQLRCDANISLRSLGQSEYGTKIEVKNLNSIRSLYRALQFEQGRQIEAFRTGQPLIQETRHWDENRGITTHGRSKEYAFDYRYFPEPDLAPVEPDAEWIEKIRMALPELPAARRRRLRDEYGLEARQAALVGGSRAWAEFFEQAVSLGAEPRAAANWMTGDVAAFLNERDVDIDGSKVTPQHVADLVRLHANGTVSSAGAKVALAEAFETGASIEGLVEAKGLRQVSEAGALESIIEEVIAENPGLADQYRGGKEGVLNALVGAVMKKSKGSANPGVAQELLRRKLSG
jgi:aspartyl-tRNA(Asn)/glutamyl-tRNA(Gln) amidotransferase subunit B